MNILDFIKWIILWTNILVLVCPRQKWLLTNVSNSSEIIQGSKVGPISVHFRGSITYTGASEGPKAIFWSHFGILNNFPHFMWMNNSIEYSGLYWFFWMNLLDFVLNWIIFRPNSKKKWIFKKDRPPLMDIRMEPLFSLSPIFPPQKQGVGSPR